VLPSSSLLSRRLESLIALVTKKSRERAIKFDSNRMSISTTSLIDANNQGLAYLEKGDFSSALYYLWHALKCAKLEFVHQHRTAPHTCQETRAGRNVLLLSPSELARRECLVQLPNMARSPEKKTLLIHTQAIQLVRSLTFSKDGFENNKISSAMVVFNLALCFHLQGGVVQDHQSDRFQQLSKAKSLYRQSYTLLVDTIKGSYNGGSTGNALIDLLVMALLNNLALLHHLDFREFSESKRVFQHLLHFVPSVQSNGYNYNSSCAAAAAAAAATTTSSSARRPSNSSSTEDDNGMGRQIDAFLQNATSIVFGLSPSAAAAAAA
jgi:hypothetical protein